MKTINIRKTFYIQSSVWRRGDSFAIRFQLAQVIQQVEPMAGARIIKILRLLRNNCVQTTYDQPARLGKN